MNLPDGPAPTDAGVLDGAGSGIDPRLAVLDRALTALYLGPAAGANNSEAAPLPSLALPAGPEVTVNAIAKDGDGAALLAQLYAIGVHGGASFGAVASGVLPIADIGALSGIANLASVSADATSIDGIPPQASQALKADIARPVFAVDGTGIPIGILSDSFNTSGNSDTLTTDIANGYLPANTQVLRDFAGGTDEGRAMAQIIHEIAPGSPILFETGEGGQAAFAANILDLAAHGAKVIVDDLSYFAEPAYQDGPIAQAVDQVEAQGVVYVSSAANNASNGYEAAFSPGANFAFNSRTETADNVAPGNSLLPVTFSGANTTVFFVLEWSQPAASASPGRGAASDLDLFLTDANGNIVNSIAATSNNIGGDPVEVLQVNTNGFAGTLFLRVGLHSGAAPSDLKLTAVGNSSGVVSFGAEASNTDSGTMYGHPAASSGPIATGAAYYRSTPVFGQSPPLNESFSSAGPTNAFFDSSGNLLPTPRIAPVVATGVDGADTSFFGGADPSHPGFFQFFGTSEAAPTLAATAALMLQANSLLTPADIRSLLQDSAVVMAGPNISGAGLVQADKAVGFASSNVIAAFAGGNSVLLGTHLADRISGGAEADVITGFGGSDTLSGGGGSDVFRDTAADLNGCTITDFGTACTIDITDVAFTGSVTAGLARATGLLTVDSHNGKATQITLSNHPSGSFRIVSDNSGGVELTLVPGETAAPALVNDGPLVAGVGQQAFIPSAYLRFVDADDAASQLTYTITTAPMHGTLLRNSAPVSSFSQSDIDSQLISYRQDGSSAASDTFAFTVSDPAGNSTAATFQLQIRTPAPSPFDGGWNIVGVADFTGDTLSDLAYQRTSDNLVEVQFLNGGIPTSGGAIINSPFDTNWTVVAQADTNGDGRADLVYRRISDGLTEIQLLNGNIAAGGGAIANNPFDASYQVVQTGDFNGDGNGDLVWRHASDGQTQIQFLRGSAGIGGGLILNSPFDESWQAVGAGDFNGDGFADLAYRRPGDGLTEIQFLNGTTPIGGGTVAGNPFDSAWQVVGVGDFNGDGFADLVYRRPGDGLTEIQFLHGSTAVGGGAIANNPFDAAWQVAGVGDFNGDGLPDLVYHRTSDGLTEIQFLNGIVAVGGGVT